MTSRLPAYFINLANRPDRRASMEGQFSALGLAASRFEAVAVADLTSDELARYSNPAAKYYLPPVVVACGMSHFRCWRAFLELPGAPTWMLLLEDDGLLSEALPDFLDEFLDVADRLPVDIVQLEVRRRPVRALPTKCVLPSGRRLVPFRSTFGSACYLISRRAILTLLRRDDLLQQPIDFTIFAAYTGPGRAIRSLLVEPGLCIQLDELGDRSASARSDIAAGRATLRQSGGRRLDRTLLAIHNLADHVIHLPHGLRRRVIQLEGDLDGRL